MALAAALRGRGFRVQTFKVGPDFLDPSYLTLASGRPCYNLDGWMTNKTYVQGLFSRVSHDADFVLIEGVMGLFDGAGPSTLEGSTAEIARWLEAPVLLVVNAHGMAGSLAALIKGYADFDPSINVAGVIANQCGSVSHGALLSDSLKAAFLPMLVGAVPRQAFPELKSRHLGLVTAETDSLTKEMLDEFIRTIELYCSIDEILRIAGSTPPIDRRVPERRAAEKRLRVGIAFDRAFHFYYQDLFDEMEDQGCELIRFSPIEDNVLPEGLHALYFGGGYPEEHADALSANGGMLEAVRGFAAANRPVYGECGGLIYLSRTLETPDGKRYPMAGLLPSDTRMLDKKKSLGYVEVTLKTSSLWGQAGSDFRGHEFHYSELVQNPLEHSTGNSDWEAAYVMKRRRSGIVTDEGFQRMRVLASYAHLYLASQPEAIKHFISACGGRI